MAPSLVLTKLPRADNSILRVLDPMAGSGTTLRMARARGHEVIGFDLDPLAVLISRAWCIDISSDSVLKAAGRVLNSAKLLAARTPLRNAYPSHGDAEDKAFVRYWFDPTSRRQLKALSESIQRVKNAHIQTVLWCAFSRLIITKQAGASRAMDVSHSRPHRVFARAPVKPVKGFPIAVQTVLRALPSGPRRPKARVELADARRIPVRSATIDIVITSPPYLNAIDYLRGHRLSLVWMGHHIRALRKIRATSIGTEAGRHGRLLEPFVTEALSRMNSQVSRLSARTRGILERYVYDMDLVVREISRVLRVKGKAVIVVGDSTVGGSYLQNSRAISFLALSRGLRVVSIRRRLLPGNRRYLPPPDSTTAGKQLRSRMTEEVILTLEKPRTPRPMHRAAKTRVS